LKKGTLVDALWTFVADLKGSVGTSHTRSSSRSSGPVVRVGEGPDAFLSPASQHTRDIDADELGRLIDELWNDLARAVASARNRTVPVKTP
jgi:hypothetical protein